MEVRIGAMRTIRAMSRRTVSADAGGSVCFDMRDAH